MGTRMNAREQAYDVCRRKGKELLAKLLAIRMEAKERGLRISRVMVKLSRKKIVRLLCGWHGWTIERCKKEAARISSFWCYGMKIVPKTRGKLEVLWTGRNRVVA